MHCLGFERVSILGCEWVIIFGFPPVVYASSNWGRYLRFPNWLTHRQLAMSIAIILYVTPEVVGDISQGYSRAAQRLLACEDDYMT